MMSNRFSRIVIVFAALVLVALSCTESDSLHPQESPTSGVVKVFCEEGFAVPMKVQGYTFGEIYPRAKAEIIYVNEKQALEGLYNDCCKVIVLTRALTKEEQKKFDGANIFIKQTFIAKDALAFVVASASMDSTLPAEKIKALLSGQDTSMRMVFDNQNSGVARYLKDSVLAGKDFGKNCFAVKNTDELVQIASSSKNVIGILDYAWLSDKDETITKEILKKVRPLAVSGQDQGTAYYPDQSNIETRDYPFCRWVHIMQRGGDFTPAAGFISFIAGQKGQLMMLKSGLVPAMRQERVIEINTAPLSSQ